VLLHTVTKFCSIAASPPVTFNIATTLSAPTVLSMETMTKIPQVDDDLVNLKEVPIQFIATTKDAARAIAELSSAVWIAADTETVARHDDGTLRNLDVDGPGALRVISIAGRFDTPDGPLRRAYVVDMGLNVPIDPAVKAMFGVSADFANIDRTVLADLVKTFIWFAWNADFDERVLLEAGVPPHGWQDLMLYQASLVLGMSGVSFYDSLSAAAMRHLGVDLEGKGTVQLSYTAREPLDVEQVRYAASDAVATCDLVEVYRRLVGEAGLVDVVALENGARPFRAKMERSGIPFDVTGWRNFLSGVQSQIETSEAALATLTGGGVLSLFDDGATPNWKPGSPDDVKKMLNQYAGDDVHSHLGRLYEKSDSVDNAALKLLNNPLADALLTWREYSKIKSTYGEKFIEFVRSDGRVHARYIQNIVSTGRLSSSKPNMQNNAPEMKAFYRPPNRPERNELDEWVFHVGQRVFILGDLGQAELRYAAELSQDAELIAAFERGDDMHCVTAGRMLHVDMDDLKINSLEEFDIYRQRGKTMNFAVIYGLGSRALAQELTSAGVPTTPDEAKKLLELYLAAFPKMAQWLNSRDAYIKSLRDNLPACDFALTIRLYKLLPLVNAARKSLKTSLGRQPIPAEIVHQITPYDTLTEELTRKLGHAPSAPEIDTEFAKRVDLVKWASGFRAAVVVLTNGEALAFESRTTVGRRRLFNISTEKWVMSIVYSICGARNGPLVALRSDFEKAQDVSLTAPDGRTLSREKIKKMFEDRALKNALLSFTLNYKNAKVNVNDVCKRAVSDCIGSLGNAFRNAPIQGGVADAVLYAYQLLGERLDGFTNAVPVQSVHDSIVLEVNVEEALAVAEVLKQSMEEGLKFFCPSVPAKADVDIAVSLDTKRDHKRDKIDLKVLVGAF
jgi:DNA polymerase I-like protein with 3'-5' exonuclease and polymerase domains